MSDEIDLANDMMDAQISRAVAKASGVVISENTTGKCWYCGEGVADVKRRWCDAECRELWEKRKR